MKAGDLIKVPEFENNFHLCLVLGFGKEGIWEHPDPNVIFVFNSSTNRREHYNLQWTEMNCEVLG